MSNINDAYELGYAKGIKDATASIEASFPNILKDAVSSLEKEINNLQWRTRVDTSSNDSLAICFKIYVRKT